MAVGTFPWRGKTTRVAIRAEQDGPTTDLVATLQASLGRKPLAKASADEVEQKAR